MSTTDTKTKKPTCRHKWRYFNTIYKKTVNRNNHCDYYRRDEFFCENCLEVKPRQLLESGTNAPDWFKNSKAEVDYMR